MEVEATLGAQTVALDAIFNGLAKRAAQKYGAVRGCYRPLFALPQKAQEQRRETLETLAKVNHPKSESPTSLDIRQTAGH
jgi:hypothetical protein